MGTTWNRRLLGVEQYPLAEMVLNIRFIPTKGIKNEHVKVVIKNWRKLCVILAPGQSPRLHS